MSARAGRLGIGIIGAGRVGPVLGAAWAGAGHALTGISASSESGRDRAEAILPGVPLLDIPAIVERSELVLLAIPSSEIESLVSGLAATNAFQPGQILVHTAPELGTGALRAAAEKGVITIALHPAMVFTGTSIDLQRLAESYVAVTAPAPVQPIGQALVVELGAEPVIIAEADRPDYAEAVATASEFSRSIVRQATGLLAEIGVENPGSFLSGLVRSSVDEALRDSGFRERPEDLA